MVPLEELTRVTGVWVAKYSSNDIGGKALQFSGESSRGAVNRYQRQCLYFW